MSEAGSLDEAFRKICAMEAPLGVRLALFTDAVKEHSEPFAIAYDRLVKQIGTADAGAAAPQLGEAMPPFLLPDHTGKLVGLAELLSAGPVVVSFNRGHWCEYCQLELGAFAAAHAEFAARGAQVVCIMPEIGEYTHSVRELTGHTMTVLSDIDNGYALEVGLVMWLGEEVVQLYRKFGLDIMRYQGNESWFVPLPATFVVGRDGIILGRKVDPDFRHRMDVEDILASLGSANQHSE